MSFVISVLAGVACGVLSGFGIGGGSLLMVWMTAVCAMEQTQAQGINLLYFLPTAVCAVIFHIKNKQIEWKTVIPTALGGCLGAVGGALLSDLVDTTLLSKFFGGFLILVGLWEVIHKPGKR